MAYINEKAMTKTRNSDYYHVAQDIITEAIPPLTYRRTNRSELTRRKAIKCPYCKNILTGLDRQTKVQVFRYSRNKVCSSIPGQIFKHCEVCKNEIGIVLK